jgi:hypothetical protein
LIVNFVVSFWKHFTKLLILWLIMFFNNECMHQKVQKINKLYNYISKYMYWLEINLFLKREYFEFKFNFWWYRVSKNILTELILYRIINMQSKHNACNLERFKYFFIILCNAKLICEKDFHRLKYTVLCFACL